MHWTRDQWRINIRGDKRHAKQNLSCLFTYILYVLPRFIGENNSQTESNESQIWINNK